MPLTRNLDLDLLRAFSVIAAERNISRAAERLLRNQSTVSLQLKRLEELVGCQLFERSSRTVRLTHDGEVLLTYAQRMLALNDEIIDRIQEPQLSGTVRIGAPEDFATTHLPSVFGDFIHTHPLVALEVTCDLTLNLMTRFRDGAFDVVLVKREPSVQMSGVRVWREPLVWVAPEGFALQKQAAVPLIVSPEPCVYRKRATTALTKAKRDFRIAYTCGSLAGTLAAVKAGLGISVLPKDMVPPDLKALSGSALPHLRDTEIALITAPNLSQPAKRLCEHIVASLEKTAKRL